MKPNVIVDCQLYPKILPNFYPCDAMLAWLLAMAWIHPWVYQSWHCV